MKHSTTDKHLYILSSSISLNLHRNSKSKAPINSTILKKMSLPDLQNEDFLEQMLCALQSAGASWPEISSGAGAGGAVGQNKSTLPWDVDLFDDQSVFLTTKLRQHQISSGDGGANLQQQLMLSTAGDTAVFRNELADNSPFKSPTGDNSIHGVFNGFAGSTTLQSNQTQNFQYPPAQTFRPSGPAAPSINQGPAAIAATASGGGGGPPAQPRQRVRARRGQATDPHSIAERLRRERIAERMKSLQELVPNANKTDKASMLDEIIDYVKFLQLQVKVLSMSRMGGVAAVAPLVADISSSEGGRDGAQGAVGGGAGRNTTTTPSSSTNDTMTVAENQVVKLMEEDMGSAMQYLQGKGLCLMPISLATAISTSTATCHLPTARNNHPTLGGSDGGATSSLNLSVKSGQSANGVLLPELVLVKDSTSVSKS